MFIKNMVQVCAAASAVVPYSRSITRPVKPEQASSCSHGNDL